MSPSEPVRIADVYAVTSERGPAYDEAARKIGLTPSEYAEFRRSLAQGDATFVRLPRHIDAMAGIHRRSGHVYALRNVVVPAGTMGWEIPLADGTVVIVPQICGNLSMNRPRALAQHAPKRVARVQPKSVRAAVFTEPAARAVAMIPETPVVFSAPAVPVVAAPAVAPVAAAAGHGLPFLGALFPGVGAIVGGVMHHGSTSAPGPVTLTGPIALPTAPPLPCSAGSNEYGVCQQ